MLDVFSTYQFANAWVLWFLLVIPVVVLIYWWLDKEKQSKLKISAPAVQVNAVSQNWQWLNHGYFSAYVLAMALLITALARPQISKNSPTFKEQYKEGIDIVLSIDASTSMLAEDFEPNRFEAAKSVANEFIQSRENDRMGLVVFAGEAYTQCPLSNDKYIVSELALEIEQGVIQDGTAIGTGLSVAINRLRGSDAKSKVIILLTDGVNTHGKIHPLNAAEMAQSLGIRVYTIGVGTNGKAKMPVGINQFTGKYIYDYMPVEIDETTLKEIGEVTGGSYFRATDKESLKQVYKQIDQLEKSKTKVVEYTVDLPEQSMPLIMAALGLIALTFISKVIFKQLV